MTKFILITALITSGAILSYLNPVYLPVSAINGLDILVQSLFLWDTFLPVLTLFQAVAFVILISICIWAYKLFKLLIS